MTTDDDTGLVASGRPAQDPPRGLPDVVELMRRNAQRIAEEGTGRVFAEIPSYARAGVPRDSLVQSVLQHTARAADALMACQSPRPEEIHDVRIATDRARRGVPVEDMLHAIRLVLGILRDHFIEWAFSLRLEPRLILEGTRILWDVTDVVTRRYATSHREEELEIARHDERQRIEFLRALVSGSLSSAELHLRAAVFGLPLDGSYVAFRARPRPDVELTELSRATTAWTNTMHRHTFFAPLGSDIAGVSTHAPSLRDLATIGVGHPSDLHGITNSFRMASRALEVGVAFGQLGVVSLESLSLRMAVASEHDVGDLMVRRYIEPLVEEGEFGKVLEQSVRAYLEADLNTEGAARALVVHPNTLRHRLHRFEAQTGADLSSSVDRMEVWWALERRIWGCTTGTAVTGGPSPVPD
ncbi:MAG: hypothetical protein GEV03_12425 [Streptosporangiales bacterium]|nr:hypothetical protein [Streptosporangiales bacterium]